MTTLAAARAMSWKSQEANAVAKGDAGSREDEDA
jgi:hypothetical protein